MKQSMLVRRRSLALGVPALRAVRRPRPGAQEGAAGQGREGQARRPERHRRGRAEDRRGRQREDPRSASASCRTRPFTSTSRWSARCSRGSPSGPSLAWTFIVLDTDGVNAFAAPGGFVHITRGALGLIKNEAELAGVLGARDRPRRAQAHGERDPEEQGGAARHQRDAVEPRAVPRPDREQGLRDGAREQVRSRRRDGRRQGVGHADREGRLRARHARRRS